VSLWPGGRTFAEPWTTAREGPLPACSAILYGLTLILAATLPFEVLAPVISVPWISISNVRLIVAATIPFAVILAVARRPTASTLRAVGPAVLLLLVVVLSALFAPDFGDEALKAAGRFVAGVYLLILMRSLAGTGHRSAGLLWAVVLGGGVSALIGLAEAVDWSMVDRYLTAFKVAPTRVAGDVRVSGTFQYATIAAMYLEMVVPIAVGLAATSGRAWQRGLALGVAMVSTIVVTLTLTRAGVLTLLLMFGFVLAWSWWRRAWRPLFAPTLLTALVLGASLVRLAQVDPVFDLRLQTEGDSDWFGADYTVPSSIRFDSVAPVTVDLAVHNSGRREWDTDDAHPFELCYRWLTADGHDLLELPLGTVPLPADVRPDETAALRVSIPPPPLPAGTYRLAWGMTQRDVLWFYERGSPDAESAVDVSPEAASKTAAQPATTPRDDAEAPWVVGRLDLWGAALRLFARQLLLGVGPDNFRNMYGTELGLDAWDTHVQANNLYLELLVDTGVVGLAAFVLLILGPLIKLTRCLRLPPAGARSFWLAGLGLALLAFLVHGLLDSFLSAPATMLLFWAILGLMLAQPEP
jgi:O-antigen ligase